MAFSQNLVILLGRIGRDAELSYTPSGTALSKFSLATSYKRGDNEETEWHNIVVWEKLAESLNDYLRKGALVFVKGYIKYRTWEKDGVKHYATDIIANEIVLCGEKGERKEASAPPATSRRSSPPDSPATRAAAPSTRRAPAPRQTPEIDDDIPF